MKIRKIIEKLKKIIEGWNVDEEELATRGANEVKTTLEQLNGNEAYDEAAKKTIELIKKHPGLAIKILETINEEVSTEVAVEAIIQLPSEKQFLGEIAVDAAKEIDFKDKQILKIISASNDLGYGEKVQIANQLNDDKRRDEVKQVLKKEEEQRVIDKLEEIYMICDENINENILEQKLVKLMEDMQIDTPAIRVNRNRIIARIVALNYARYGTNIVSKQRRLMSAKQMYENGIIRTAKEEYKKVVKEYGGMIKGIEIKEFDEEELEQNMLEEIKVTERDSEFDEKAVLERIIRMMQTTLPLEERKRILESLEQWILNKDIKETYLDMIESGLIGALSQLPHSERKNAFVRLKKATIKRNLTRNVKVAEKTPRVKECKFDNEGR